MIDPTPKWPSFSAIKEKVNSIRDLRDTFSFRGRERDVDALNAALKTAVSNKSGVIVLEGEPGIGKSALAAHWAGQLRSDLGEHQVLDYYFLLGDSEINKEGTFLKYVCAQLSLQLGIEDYSGQNGEGLHSCFGDALKAAGDAVQASKPNGRLVLVLDGIEESPNYVRILQELPIRSGVIVVIFAQPGIVNNNWGLSGVTRIELADYLDATSALKLFRDVLNQEGAAGLLEENQEAVRQLLIQEPMRLPLLVCEAARDFVSNKGKIKKKWRNLGGIEGYFTGRTEKCDAGVKILLGVLAYAKENLSEISLGEIAGARVLDVPAALHVAGKFLKKNADGRWSFSHNAWARAARRAGSPFDGGQKLITDWAQAQWQRAEAPGRDYGLKYLPAHLFESGELEQLSDTLASTKFLELKAKWLRDQREAVSGLGQDVEFALRLAAARQDLNSFLRCWERRENLHAAIQLGGDGEIRRLVSQGSLEDALATALLERNSNRREDAVLSTCCIAISDGHFARELVSQAIERLYGIQFHSSVHVLGWMLLGASLGRVEREAASFSVEYLEKVRGVGQEESAEVALAYLLGWPGIDGVSKWSFFEGGCLLDILYAFRLIHGQDEVDSIVSVFRRWALRDDLYQEMLSWISLIAGRGDQEWIAERCALKNMSEVALVRLLKTDGCRRILRGKADEVRGRVLGGDPRMEAREVSRAALVFHLCGEEGWADEMVVGYVEASVRASGVLSDKCEMSTRVLFGQALARGLKRSSLSEDEIGEIQKEPHGVKPAAWLDWDAQLWYYLRAPEKKEIDVKCQDGAASKVYEFQALSPIELMSPQCQARKLLLAGVNPGNKQLAGMVVAWLDGVGVATAGGVTAISDYRSVAVALAKKAQIFSEGSGDSEVFVALGRPPRYEACYMAECINSEKNTKWIKRRIEELIHNESLGSWNHLVTCAAAFARKGDVGAAYNCLAPLVPLIQALPHSEEVDSALLCICNDLRGPLDAIREAHPGLVEGVERAIGCCEECLTNFAPLSGWFHPLRAVAGSPLMGEKFAERRWRYEIQSLNAAGDLAGLRELLRRQFGSCPRKEWPPVNFIFSYSNLVELIRSGDVPRSISPASLVLGYIESLGPAPLEREAIRVERLAGVLRGEEQKEFNQWLGALKLVDPAAKKNFKKYFWAKQYTQEHDTQELVYTVLMPLGPRWLRGVAEVWEMGDWPSLAQDNVTHSLALTNDLTAVLYAETFFFPTDGTLRLRPLESWLRRQASDMAKRQVTECISFLIAAEKRKFDQIEAFDPNNEILRGICRQGRLDLHKTFPAVEAMPDEEEWRESFEKRLDTHERINPSLTEKMTELVLKMPWLSKILPEALEQFAQAEIDDVRHRQRPDMLKDSSVLLYVKAIEFEVLNRIMRPFADSLKGKVEPADMIEFYYEDMRKKELKGATSILHDFLADSRDLGLGSGQLIWLLKSANKQKSVGGKRLQKFLNEKFSNIARNPEFIAFLADWKRITTPRNDAAHTRVKDSFVAAKVKEKSTKWLEWLTGFYPERINQDKPSV